MPVLVRFGPDVAVTTYGRFAVDEMGRIAIGLRRALLHPDRVRNCCHRLIEQNAPLMKDHDWLNQRFDIFNLMCRDDENTVVVGRFGNESAK